MSDFFDNWTVQVRKGVLELCILNALAERERYGYELVKSLVDNPGLGMTEGTLYPLLSRLRAQGLVGPQILFPEQRRAQGRGADERLSGRSQRERPRAAQERSNGMMVRIANQPIQRHNARSNQWGFPLKTLILFIFRAVP